MSDAPIAARLAAAQWFRSSYSAVNNECVEVAQIEQSVGIRDSKDPARGVLAIDSSKFSLFLDNVKEEASTQVRRSLSLGEFHSRNISSQRAHY